MPTTIINKLGRGVPSPSNLIVGEIAQDESTGSLYVKTDGGDVIAVGGGQARDYNQNIDGGGASTIYLLDQIINGGSA